MQTSQQDLLALKTALEKPGVGKKRHDLAEKFRDRDDMPLEWIREWLNTKWHVIGCKYLWLAAMNACIGARRTVDEKPPEARSNICFSSFSLSSTVSASANDVTCDIWDT